MPCFMSVIGKQIKSCSENLKEIHKRQKHNQLGIVCFTFSDKKFFVNISFMHKTFEGYVGHMILQDFQLDFLGFKKNDL